MFRKVVQSKLTRQNVFITILVTTFRFLAFFAAVEMFTFLLLQAFKFFPETSFSSANTMLFL